MKKNHPDFNIEYIIKNNEKSIKFLLHPKDKNLAFFWNIITIYVKSVIKVKTYKLY